MTLSLAAMLRGAEPCSAVSTSGRDLLLPGHRHKSRRVSTRQTTGPRHGYTRVMTRRGFLGSAIGAAALAAAPRKWPLGLNTYCLRFQRWNDRKLFDYCVQQKMDSIFLQDSLDPGVMNPEHWKEVRAWAK